MVVYINLGETLSIQFEEADYKVLDNGVVTIRDTEGNMYKTHISNVLIIKKGR